MVRIPKKWGGSLSFVSRSLRQECFRNVGSVPPRALIRTSAKRKNGPMGFVEEDNSGKSNIFAVEPKTLYVSSPRSDRVSSTGLGGSQGLQLVLGLIGVVGGITILLQFQNSDVEKATMAYDSQRSLQEIVRDLK
eukprot:jgi/Picsp_1/481/NSC_00479-R1_predicted protein [Micromonas pusilla CCMP1545]